MSLCKIFGQRVNVLTGLFERIGSLAFFFKAILILRMRVVYNFTSNQTLSVPMIPFVINTGFVSK